MFLAVRYSPRMVADESRVANVNDVANSVCEAQVDFLCRKHVYVYFCEVSEATSCFLFYPRGRKADFLEYVVDTLLSGLEYDVCDGGIRQRHKRRLGLVTWCEPYINNL